MRSEQDEAYEQSLRCDQQKDKEAAERQQLEKVTSSYYIAVFLCLVLACYSTVYKEVQHLNFSTLRKGVTRQLHLGHCSQVVGAQFK